MSAPAHSRPFDLAAAQAGAPIGSRHGDDAYFIAHVPEAVSQSRVIVRFKSGEIGTRRENGKHYEGGEQVPGDLVMLPLGFIDGKPVFVGDAIEDGGDGDWTPGTAHPGNRLFTNCRWPAPPKVYPETQMTESEIISAYYGGGPVKGPEEEIKAFFRIAKAALKHAIDAGQVVPVSEAKPGLRRHNPYTGQLRDPRDIESDPMGMLILQADDAPAGFTVDMDATLRATGESKAQVAYKKHALEADDVRRHIAAGKQVTKLAMTWNDRISFELDEMLTIKKIKPLDVIKETESSTKNDEERFDSDMMLMTGELARMMADIVEALGGEATVSEPGEPAAPRTAAPASATRAAAGISKLLAEDGATATLTYGGNTLSFGGRDAPGEPPDLYDQAVAVVLAHRRASISLVQRHLRIGYNRAARLMEEMEAKGVIGTMASNGDREILAQVGAGGAS